MNLQALLVSSDDVAADVLGRVLSGFDIAMDRSSDPETTLARIHQQKFDALIVDFDNPETAERVLQEARKLGTNPLSVALVADSAKVRAILSDGAHFVLYKPISEEAAAAGLKPAAALLSRERRRAVRIPVQAPVEITLPDNRKVDGILLDLSETGMDVLTAEPQVQGALLAFHFQLPDGAVEVEAHGQVAWANPNGQTGVHFLDVSETVLVSLKAWLKAAAASMGTSDAEAVPHCKLTDLSLGGCYVQTQAPFPERALIDFCLKTKDLEVHTEGMVRVVHPGLGMGVEFPSRTEEQRAQVGNVIDFLRNSPEAMPELIISPRALVADLTQFEPADKKSSGEELEDPLLELLRRGDSLQQEEFLAELEHQRNPEDVASA
ncbi:MAG TPA: PilZ domain-containing protein [Candidatus Sulfotelmatobacter sp.]|nr:PilZ domain-containing protein [Candidatus Sulfotelmatobacter sp.]